jgi:hypothetical protein
MRELAPGLIVAAALLAAAPTHAHHGIAAVSVAGPEGPGAALETTSALPLPQGAAFTMLKGEYVSFRQLADVPDGKDYASFNMLVLGFGIRPWLSAYVFQPFAVKSQETVGENAGPGDTNLMLAFGFKYDDGLRLIPEKESLDDLMDWHFSVWVASTLPVGPTSAQVGGELWSPDMQTGFGSPSPSAGLAVMKQVSEDLTWLAEASYQAFLPHTYDDGLRYRFGGETRVNTAAVWRAYGSGPFRLDLSGELLGLHLQRDQSDEAGSMEPLEASGGAILYGGLGVRAIYRMLSAAAGVKRAIAKDLNERPQQQGSEGLESFRVSLTLSYSVPL